MYENAPLYNAHLLTKAHELAKELGALLKTRHLMLTLAESCTGGMVAETITSVAGSSAWFDCGLITYSNQSKIDLLKVSNQSLEAHGAVSEAVASEMALGCLLRVEADIKHTYIAGSITGIAGPDGGSQQKPVGTVCFAWTRLDSSTNIQVKTKTEFLNGNRQEIRQQATIYLLENLITYLSQADS